MLLSTRQEANELLNKAERQLRHLAASGLEKDTETTELLADYELVRESLLELKECINRDALTLPQTEEVAG